MVDANEYKSKEMTGNSSSHLEEELANLAEEHTNVEEMTLALRKASIDLKEMRHLTKLVKRAQKLILKSIKKRQRYSKEQCALFKEMKAHVKEQRFDRMLSIMKEGREKASEKITLTKKEMVKLGIVMDSILKLKQKATCFSELCDRINADLAPLLALADEELEHAKCEQISEAPLEAGQKANQVENFENKTEALQNPPTLSPTHRDITEIDSTTK